MVECCFTSTETRGLLGMGAQDSHAPQLSHSSWAFSTLEYSYLWVMYCLLLDNNIQGGSQKFLGHFKCHFRSEIISSESSKQGHTKQINPQFAAESEFDHICVLQCAYIYMLLSDIWSRSSFCWSNHARFLSADVSKTIDCVLRTHPYRLNQSQFLLQRLASFPRYDPVSVILLIFVAQNGV